MWCDGMLHGAREAMFWQQPTSVLIFFNPRCKRWGRCTRFVSNRWSRNRARVAVAELSQKSLFWNSSCAPVSLLSFCVTCLKNQALVSYHFIFLLLWPTRQRTNTHLQCFLASSQKVSYLPPSSYKQHFLVIFSLKCYPLPSVDFISLYALRQILKALPMFVFSFCFWWRRFFQKTASWRPMEFVRQCQWWKSWRIFVKDAPASLDCAWRALWLLAAASSLWMHPTAIWPNSWWVPIKRVRTTQYMHRHKSLVSSEIHRFEPSEWNVTHFYPTFFWTHE